MKKSFLTVLLFVLNLSFGQNKQSNSIEEEIDHYIKNVIEINQIPGVALAVIKDGKVIYENYFGKANLEENKAVDKNTAFKIFSTTKLITTVGVFQLIETGKLSLEDPISKYLDNLPKEWQEIQIKNLLTHSSGLPDVVQFDDIPFTLPYTEKISLLAKKPMQFATGNQYRYNQTNYLFLAKIIEKITGLTFDEYILKNQFPEAKSNTFFLSDFGQLTPNGAVRYNYNIENKKYEKNNYNSGPDSHSANGLNITLSEFIKWNENLDKDVYLKKETKYSMWQQFHFANNTDRFAYGWEIIPVNKILSYGFTGGNETAFRKFTNNDLTIIFLSNGHKYSNLYVQSQVINHVAAIVDKTLRDDYLLAGEKINQDFLKLKISASEQNYLTLKKNHPDWNFEYRLNIIGYALMNDGRLNDAIKVFELNAKENPKSGTAFDSLAESYFNNKQLEIARKTYEKSLELSPDNSNAKEMLEKIKIQLSKKS
ncbi:CubicO group peptidase, beta-lactamase class C family [Flavobacterium aquidurense]|uniref:Serine hydrolase n=1 Tax=Flavobacterium frigidimaris TaxID=262320 RepID=A0ABX4BW05_FLAFR|nr:serine hydrolase domain-containing protein [Flavobacterium frigidimaris]OXA81708.1 serine hydrolase [Flavobacterium frigidimaris]SDZ54613.1 CubicO group peptidase, beta-lactamase class C family [Flavobacterium aquidurense]